MLFASILFVAAAAATLAGGVSAKHHAPSPAKATVRVTNVAPEGGVAFTPVFVGFHDGSFDLFNLGKGPVPSGLETIAEIGQAGELVDDFLAGLTYTDGKGEAGKVLTADNDGTRRAVVLGDAPILPGGFAEAQVTLSRATNDNEFFSFASMVLPSSDFFVANAGAKDCNIAEALAKRKTFSVCVGGTVYDAGTEVNDFKTAAGVPLFAGEGQPLEGTEAAAGESDDNDAQVVRVAYGNFAGFSNTPEAFNWNPLTAPLQFTCYASPALCIDITFHQPHDDDDDDDDDSSSDDDDDDDDDSSSSDDDDDDDDDDSSSSDDDDDDDDSSDRR